MTKMTKTTKKCFLIGDDACQHVYRHDGDDDHDDCWEIYYHGGRDDGDEHDDCDGPSCSVRRACRCDRAAPLFDNSGCCHVQMVSVVSMGQTVQQMGPRDLDLGEMETLDGDPSAASQKENGPCGA